MIRLLLFFVIFFSACAPRPQSGTTLKEAQTIQSTALKMGQEVEAQLQQLDQQRIRIEVQGRALNSEEIKFIAEVNNLAARFEEWQKNKPKLPTKQRALSDALLQKQKNYLSTIQAINEKAISLVE